MANTAGQCHALTDCYGRHRREVDGSGTSYWWRSLGRNKKSVCVDLRAEEGRELIREMLPHFDALVENFRPGRMEEWGLSPEACWGINPDLVYTRVSGYGQTGPYASRPGFASACEAMGGQWRALIGCCVIWPTPQARGTL